MNTQLQKPRTQSLQTMNKSDKEKFFSMDLAQRMIRIEQDISKSFKCPVTMEQTEYYKSMSNQQKEDFKKFLQKNKKKKILSFSWLLAPILLISLFNINFTGNAIRENVGPFGFGVLQVLLIILFAFILVGFFIAFAYRISVERRLRSHIKLIEHILGRKFSKYSALNKIKKAF